MIALAVVGVLGGMGILVLGAGALVRGASRLAAAAGISSLVIGLTVVAFGTSAPELAVSVGAAVTGAGEVAVGNAIGSNIFNTLAILGVSALFGGLVVHRRIVRVDVPILLAVTAAVWWMAADGTLGIAEGSALLAEIVGYSLLAYLLGRREPQPAGGRPRRHIPTGDATTDRLADRRGHRPRARRARRRRPAARRRRYPSRLGPRGVRPDHRSHRRRSRHLAAGARDVRRGHPPRRARHRRGQHRRVQRVQWPS
jgi:Ca2+/Na+ antiporter